jgi:hypothetical protein
MFGPVNESGVWEDPYRLDIISDFRKGKLRWLGHAEGMPEERCVKNVFILDVANQQTHIENICFIL